MLVRQLFTVHRRIGEKGESPCDVGEERKAVPSLGVGLAEGFQSIFLDVARSAAKCITYLLDLHSLRELEVWSILSSLGDRIGLAQQHQHVHEQLVYLHILHLVRGRGVNLVDKILNGFFGDSSVACDSQRQ